MLRDSVATEYISTFGITPKTNVQPSEDPVLEIPLSEFQAILADLTTTYNLVAEMCRDSGILRGRELARMTATASEGIKAIKSPAEKVILLSAHTRRLLVKVRETLKSRPSPEGGRVIQVCTKIMSRAISLIDYIKTYGDDPSGKRDIALDSQQARLLFKGADKEAVSRRDTIRAMRRAEKLWSALQCGHRPNDGRMTMRLTISREDLGCGPEFGYCDTWLRSGKSIELAL